MMVTEWSPCLSPRAKEAVLNEHPKKGTARDSGFTLTELAVAMLIVGILAAIAVPSFLGARDNAYDREAQSAVDAALNAAVVHYSNYGDFSPSDTATCGASADATIADDLQRLEPNFDFLADNADSDNPRKVSVDAANTYNADDEDLGCQVFYAAALSRSGICWVGRLSIEGTYLATTATDAIIVKSDGSDSNAEIVELGGLAVNGRAYGALKVDSKAADGGAVVTDPAADTLAEAQGLCNAQDQSARTAGVLSTEFYDSWRTVVNSSNGYTES